MEEQSMINEMLKQADQEREKIKQLNIFERLSAITAELKTVAKNSEIQQTKTSKYKATKEKDVLNAVKPLEHKYRVYSYPYSRSILESGTIETTYENGGSSKKFFERIETKYRFINIDKPEEFIDITTYGDGIDSGDKSVGKAMTYADKYALLKAYKIETGEDPDDKKSDEIKKATLKKRLDKALVAELDKLKIDLKNVAVYLKKDISDLTDEDLKACIKQKKAAIEGGAQ